jgi:hypothetical protein
MSKALTPTGLPSVAVAVGATTPNPGYPAVIWSTTTSGVMWWNGTSWQSVAPLASPTFTGTVTGNGSGLSSLNASNLSSGTIDNARLPTTFTGNNTHSGTAKFTSSVEIESAAPLLYLHETDQAADARLWRMVLNGGVIQFQPRTDADGAGTPGVAFSIQRDGDIDWTGAASGSGAGITSLNGSNIASGTVADARLPTSFGAKSFTGAITLDYAAPSIYLNETDQAADAKLTRLIVSAGTLFMQPRTDADATTGVGTAWSVSRIGDMTWAGTATGNGSGITTINGSNISSGTVADARLPTTLGGKAFSATCTFAGSSHAFNQTVPTASSQSSTPVLSIGAGGGSGLVIARATADSGGARMHFVKTRAATADGRTAVQSGDVIMSQFFEGTDGTNPVPAARIDASVNGTVSTGIVPGKLTFVTYTTGGVATDALTIDAAQTVAVAKLFDLSGGAAGQIKFTAAGNASADVNTFDWMKQGSYTGTGTGFSGGAPTATIRYERQAGVVNLSIALLSGTSNATTFTITGAPTEIRPAADRAFPLLVRNNTGAFTWGKGVMSSTGTLTCYLTPDQGAFTASGTKACGAQDVQYLL